MFKRILSLSVCILLIAACAPAARSSLVIDEHLLTAPPDLSTDQLVFHFATGDQAQLLEKTAAYRNFHRQYEEYNRQALATFGYVLKDEPGNQPDDVTLYSIYRGDQLIGKDVMYMPPLSLSASQTAFVGLASLADGSYLFTRDGFELQPYATGRQVFGYVGDQLLSVEVTSVSAGLSRLQAYLGDQAAYSTQFNNVSTWGAFDGPWTYGNHWALILLDAKPDAEQGPTPYQRLIQDGQDINAVKSYEQSFQFAVLDGQPFYFYQKSSKIGISFDGREIAKGYDEIPHYQCCTPALLNPGKSMNMVWFFARRGTAWYYVEAYVPTAP